MVITGSVQAKTRRVQPGGIPIAVGLAAIDWLDSGIYGNAQQAITCCGYQRQSGLLLKCPAGARYLVWSHLWNNVPMPHGDVMLIADDRTNTNLGRARHRGSRALHRECRFYLYLVPITHRQSSRQAASGKDWLEALGRACLSLWLAS